MKDLAADIESYETEVVKYGNMLDLYKRKDKSKNKISFNDLTLHENLNYVKYTL
jgi:hypothetical protein